MTNQKSTINLILLIIIVALVAALVYVVAVPKSERDGEPSPTPSPAPQDETAGWKTYRNEEYGFEVRYPTGWIVEVADNNGDGPIIAGVYFSNPHPVPCGPNPGQTCVDQSAWGIQIFNKNNVANDGGVKLEHGDKVYAIFNEGLQPELFDQFLSTFRFIE